MQEKTKRKKGLTVRHLVRIVAYTCTLITAAAVIGITGWKRAERYEDYMKYTYQRAFDSLVVSVDKISTTLQKAVHANSPSSLSMLAADVWDQSTQAKAYLGELPVSFIQLDNTAKFISQVGGYAYTLAAKAADGELLSEEDRQNLITLAANAEQLAFSLFNLAAYEEVDSFFEGDPDYVLEKIVSTDKNVTQQNMVQGMSVIEEEFPQSPTLIYDGPFSEHITKRVPAILTADTRDVTVEEARSSLAELFMVDAGQIVGGTELDADLPVYSFVIQRGESDACVDVTKRGGRILSMVESRPAGIPQISSEEAIEKAERFLNRAGFLTISPTYWHTANNVMYINFADLQQNVLIYPDLLQIGIALDNGAVSFVQARGWLMNHRPRTLLSPVLTEEQAMNRLSPLLRVENVQLAYIPTPGENEVFCYEFLCRGHNDRGFLVYINAQNGREEKIMLLVEDENGTLTI